MSYATLRPIEALEARRLFAMTAAVEDGLLTITGTERRDAIVVELSRDDSSQLLVRSGRDRAAFAVSDVASGVINGGAGGDRIRISERFGKIFIPFTVDAGDGRDSVITGSGNDVIVGGAGSDRIIAGSGDDQLNGGDGNDRLLGGTDNDLIIAGAGRDRLVGGAGNDNLDGGDGRDAVVTGAGTDDVAVDATNTREVRDRAADRADDVQYEVTDVSDLSPELAALVAEAIPGASAVRAQRTDTTIAIYYHFGTDPAIYKLLLDLSGAEPDLISREISPQEVRSGARARFAEQFPGTEVVSVFQHSGSRDDIRYRDADGILQMRVTRNWIWTVDDAQEDLDNDGYSDRAAEGRGGEDLNEYDEFGNRRDGQVEVMQDDDQENGGNDGE